MSTETAPPPVAAPAKPITPAIPAAQAASVKPAPQPAKPATTSPRTPPDAPPSLDREMRELADKHFAPKTDAAKSAAVVVPPAKTEPAAPPKQETAAKEAPAAPTEKEPLDIAEPKGMTPENLANWKTWREQAKKEINDAKNEKAALAAKLKTYETAAPADTEKAARLEAQLKELQDKLAVHDVSSHPDFVRQYVEPKKNALREAGEIVAYNGKEGVNLAAVLDKPLKEFNAAVSELTKEMNGMDASSVQTALRNAYKLANDEKAALGNAQDLKAKLDSKSAAEARRAFDETRADVTSKIAEIPIPDNAPPEKVAEIEAFNKARSEALAEAEQYSFGRISEKEVARISHQAAMLKPVATILIPALQRDLKASNALVAELSAELAAIKKGKNPPAFVGGKDAASAVDTSKMDLKQLAEHMLTRRSA